MVTALVPVYNTAHTHVASARGLTEELKFTDCYIKTKNINWLIVQCFIFVYCTMKLALNVVNRVSEYMI